MYLNVFRFSHQMFLTSVKPALKFGTMRTLSEVAAKYPMSILKCNPDMEVLISDPNRYLLVSFLFHLCEITLTRVRISAVAYVCRSLSYGRQDDPQDATSLMSLPFVDRSFCLVMLTAHDSCLDGMSTSFDP